MRAVLALMLAACPAEEVDDDAAGTSAASTGEGAAVETEGELGCSECGQVPACNSEVGGDGECYCNMGFEWANPDDDRDFACQPIEPGAGECTDPNAVMMGGQCSCVCGYTWCSDDPDDLSCCVDPDADC